VSWRWAEHLGTGLTVGYLVLIAIGMLHTFVRFRRFGINILDFAEPSDFLLAPVRDPLVILATIIPVLLVSGYLRAAKRVGDRSYARRRAAGVPVGWWETKEENIARMRPWLEPLRYLTMLVWVVSGALWYQLVAARRVMLGDAARVTVETTAGTVEAGTDRRPVMLIGTTSRYLFLFRTEDWRTVIYPTENVLRITPATLARGTRRVRPEFIRRMDSTPAPR